LQTAINNSWSVDDGYRSGLVESALNKSLLVDRPHCDRLCCRLLFTDVGAVLMDPFSTGDPIELAALLLDQLSRHITKLGNNVGVVFDHLGVSELYNLAEDDGEANFNVLVYCVLCMKSFTLFGWFFQLIGLSWIPVSESGERGPGRSLRDTFQQFFASAAALLHNSSHPRVRTRFHGTQTCLFLL
jgi:hypothetical protein